MNQTQNTERSAVLTELNNHLKTNQIKVKVIPNSSSSEIIGIDPKTNTLKVKLQSPPEKNKANKELIQLFKKEYGKKVEIISGSKSRNKVVEIKREDK